MKLISNDPRWMRTAISLAAMGVGLTRPNPPVGAVVVRGGKIVGRGYHHKAGEPHAEIHALRNAGARARGATLYVTLEPCSTQGRTPPCTDAIVASGIKRVVYGCTDPNPKHVGRAAIILKRAGIDVEQGVLAPACEALIRPFAMRMRKSRPYVTLKLACTLDGKIADARGQSKWITGPSARSAVQSLRRSADAIMIGAGTLRADNPSLLPRPDRGRTPFRVIIKGTKSLPSSSAVFTDAAASQTVVYEAKTGLGRILCDLARRDVMHVVCEGGGILAEELLRADLVDELWLFYAPKIVGERGRASFAGKGWLLAAAPRFSLKQVKRYGDDVLMKLERSHV